LAEWLVKEAQTLGIGGATLISASEGFGHDHKLHSARFFEFSDQPVQVTMAVTEEESKSFFQRLRQEEIKVFYVKTPIEFGMSDDVQ
jgi:PII-like signaling protein